MDSLGKKPPMKLSDSKVREIIEGSGRISRRYFDRFNDAQILRNVRRIEDLADRAIRRLETDVCFSECSGWVGDSIGNLSESYRWK